MRSIFNGVEIGHKWGVQVTWSVLVPVSVEDMLSSGQLR